MRRFVVLAFGVIISTESLAQEPDAAHAASVVAISQNQTAAAEKTIVYKSMANATAPCARVIDDKSLRALVQAQAREVGVEEKLALVILNLESHDGAALNSPKGARGPMQLMPATAARYGVRDICDPEQNVHGAMLFLKSLSAQFSGNLMLIAAAYNAGTERVRKANGVPAISETVRYVASAANQYYDLGPLAARSNASSAHRAEAPETSDAIAVADKKSEPARAQNWIGGSVLYVQSENQGDH